MENQEEKKGDEEDKLAQCEKEREEYLNGWKRAKADLINYKKGEAERLEAITKFANETLLRDLIIILDSFTMAISALEKTGETEKEKGIFLIKSQLEETLKRYGLERIHVAVDEPFNPAFHEAVATAKTDKPAGIIVEEIEPGYTLHGKVIRPARVKVNNK